MTRPWPEGFAPGVVHQNSIRPDVRSTQSPRRRPLRGGSVHAGLVGENHDLDAAAEIEFHQNPLHVAADRGLLDNKLRGDFAVREPARDQLEDLPLAWSGSPRRPRAALQTRSRPARRW